MRTLVGSLGGALLVALAFVGCGREEASVESATRNESPRSTAASAEAPASEAVVKAIDVEGLVTSDLDEPISGRTVVLVDARGARQETLTGADGGFVIGNVRPPYDLAATPGASGVATVHLGLGRRDPHVELFERSGPTPSPARQTIRVGLRAPSCGAPSCWIAARSVSPSGTGGAATSCQRGDNLVVVDVDHGWRGLSVVPGELIDVHLLVADDARSTFAYARVPAIAAAPGDTIDVGIVDAMPVRASEPITVGANGGAGAIADWRWTTSVSLDLAGETDHRDAAMPLASAADVATTIRWPMIPGVQLRAAVAASHPRGDEQGGFFRSIEAWSGVRRPGLDPIGIDVMAGPDIVRPATGGTLSRRGLGFEWSSSSAAVLSTLTVVDTARGAARFRVVTTGHEVPLERLAAIGLPKLGLGKHLLDLTTSPRVGIDDAVSPDAEVRRRREDYTHAGDLTRLRVPFEVTE
jgi:hypothetical protein